MSAGETEPRALAAERVEALVAAGATLVDVRRRYEWEGGRIPGARHVELDRLTERAGSIPRDRPVVFYCRGGNRSQMAADAFAQGGWEAYKLDGGIHRWAEAGRKLDPADGEVRAPLPAT